MSHVGSGRQGVHREVRRLRQTLEEPAQVGARIDASTQATTQEAVERCGALACSDITWESPGTILGPCPLKPVDTWILL